MFQDLLNFDDPLNLEAAEHYQRDKVRIVYIQYYIIRHVHYIYIVAVVLHCIESVRV